jgi:CRP-like cAMP-binding protein
MNKHPLFNNVDLNHIKKQLHTKTYNENTLIFSEGEKCNSLGVIISGELTISTLTNYDKEYTINILGKNDIFGENLLFNEDNAYLGDGIITKESKILFISKELLLELLTNRTFLTNYLSIISKNAMEVRQRLKLLSQKSISDRILFYLNSESKRLRTNIIPIKNKEILANTLNIPRPSLSRELINLKRNNLIEYDKKTITLK